MKTQLICANYVEYTVQQLVSQVCLLEMKFVCNCADPYNNDDLSKALSSVL